MMNRNTLAALAAFVLTAMAFAGTPCGIPQDPTWDPQEGTCQGQYFPSCQDTNLITDGGCIGDNQVKSCSSTEHQKTKTIYKPHYRTQSCDSSTNPCESASTGSNITYHTGSRDGSYCITAETPITPSN